MTDMEPFTVLARVDDDCLVMGNPHGMKQC